MPLSRRGAPALAALSLAFALGRPGLAERLPIQRFTAASGLAGDSVRSLFVDRRGLLWISTSSGLSRFDGQQFRNYDNRDGLPSPRVEAVAESGDGSIWVACGTELARLRPQASAPGPLFELQPLPPELAGVGVDGLLSGADGVLWGVSDRHFVRIEVDAAGEAHLSLLDPAPEIGPEGSFGELALAPDGTLYTTSARGVVRRSPDGAAERLLWPQPYQGPSAVAIDGEGRLWVSVGGDLFVWVPEPIVPGSIRRLERTAPAVDRLGALPRRAGEMVEIAHAAGLPATHMGGIALAPGHAWIATRLGLFEMTDSGSRLITPANGLAEFHQAVVTLDREGMLWLGTESRGLERLLPSGFESFGEEDGLASDRISSVFESPPGELYVVTMSRSLHRYREGRFVDITPQRLYDGVVSGWGWNETIQRDREGRFWFPTSSGLFRYPVQSAPERLVDAAPERKWTAPNDFTAVDIFRLFEDRAGDFWVAVLNIPMLYRLAGGERAEAVDPFAGREPLGAPTAFAEDASGALWLGFYQGGLSRRRDGVWERFEAADGVPPGLVAQLFVDKKGRLWIAAQEGGVAVIDDPTAAKPRFHRYSTRDGLAADNSRCITEDVAGRIYIGGSRGVDRLDPESGRVRSFSDDDGLPNDMVRTCHAAADGDLWFGTLHGLARYRPPVAEPRPEPRVWISGVRVAGRPRAVPERGVEQLPEMELRPDERALEIDFFGQALAAGLGKNLLYEHRVNGGDWSEASGERRLHLASLAPGDYRVEIRAATRDGLASSRPASLAFRLPPPLHRRPWFVATAALLLLAAIAGAIVGAMRVRSRRLLAVERTRTRIASDLHDDVGASVSRIGLLGELARQRLHGEPGAAERYLEEIGSEARELAEATSDIVWAVDPRRDDLGSLTVRLRRFAEDLMEANEIELDFVAPPDAGAIRLAPEVRRALYLALKESIHNVARHSRAAAARVEIAAAGGEVTAEVLDDGCGIAAGREGEAAHEGRHGLESLRRRAAEVGGSAAIETPPGGGTRILFRFPLRPTSSAPPSDAGRSLAPHENAGRDGPAADRKTM